MSFFLSTFLFLASPQTESVSYWNSVLDCYQRLCDACMSNKDSKSIAEIKGELDALLKKPSGRMNSSQRERFNKIRQRYNGANAGSIEKGNSDTIVIVKQIPVEKVREIDHVVVYDTVKVRNNISTVVVEHLYSRKDTTIIVHTLAPAQDANVAFAGESTRRPMGWFIGATAGFVPNVSANLMAGVGNRSGLYIKGGSNFRSIKSEYSINTNSVEFWGNGKSEETRFVVCMGGWFTVYKRLRMYAGAGYGENCYYLQDMSQKWVEVSNSSYRSFALDLGLMYSFGRVMLVGGVNTTAFKYMDIEAGIAVCFGK